MALVHVSDSNTSANINNINNSSLLLIFLLQILFLMVKFFLKVFDWLHYTIELWGGNNVLFITI